mgnify:CR=1 FL=1
MKIYTKTGDKGYTQLGGGGRVHKTDQRIEAYGTVDELSSFIGLALSSELPEKDLAANLLWVQRKLFEVGAILAFPGREVSDGRGEVCQEDLESLERIIDEISAQLPTLKGFILPGGSKEASLLHCARSICRRAERLVSGLDIEEYPLGENILPFLNRLSDYLFCAARFVNHEAGVDERLAKKANG